MKKFCTKCGTSLTGDQAFCHNCGAQVTFKVAKESASNNSLTAKVLPAVIAELRPTTPLPDYYKANLALNKIKELEPSHHIEVLQQIAFLYSKIDELYHSIGIPLPTNSKLSNNTSDTTSTTQNTNNWKKYAGMAAASFAGTALANQFSAHASTPTDLPPFEYDSSNFISPEYFTNPASLEELYLENLFGVDFVDHSNFNYAIESGMLGDVTGEGDPLGLSNLVDGEETEGLFDSILELFD